MPPDSLGVRGRPCGSLHYARMPAVRHHRFARIWDESRPVQGPPLRLITGSETMARKQLPNRQRSDAELSSLGTTDSDPVFSHALPIAAPRANLHSMIPNADLLRTWGGSSGPTAGSDASARPKTGRNCAVRLGAACGYSGFSAPRSCRGRLGIPPSTRSGTRNSQRSCSRRKVSRAAWDSWSRPSRRYTMDMR